MKINHICMIYLSYLDGEKKIFISTFINGNESFADVQVLYLFWTLFPSDISKSNMCDDDDELFVEIIKAKHVSFHLKQGNMHWNDFFALIFRTINNF